LYILDYQWFFVDMAIFGKSHHDHWRTWGEASLLIGVPGVDRFPICGNQLSMSSCSATFSMPGAINEPDLT
jgi:hypothetical protein